MDGSFRLSRRHAADDVADGQAASALLAGFAKRRQRVGGFARLRDDDHQRVSIDDEVAIAILGAVVDFDRQAGESFDEEFAHQRCMPRRAARDQDDLVDAAHVRLGDRNFFQEHAARVDAEPSKQGFFGCARLLEDLFEHEMAVTGFFRHDRIPHHALSGLRHGHAGKVR